MARPRRSGRQFTFLGVTGEVLVTLGVLILLFVGWQLWWTDVIAGRAYADTRANLEQQWQLGDGRGALPRPVTPEPGKAFGLIYIPAMGDRSWGVPIIQGTSLDLLQEGVGHHPESAMPGQVGNMVIAGHRTTYGAPFGDIETLKPGDQVIVETRNGWYIYQLDRNTIIEGTDRWILDAAPGEPKGTAPTERLITIYSCHPKYSAAQRFVWFGHLVDEYPRSAGTPAAIQQHGTE